MGRIAVYYDDEHGGNRPIVETAEGVDSMIDWLLAHPERSNMAEITSLERKLTSKGRPDHQLLIGVKASLQVGVLALRDNQNYVSLGSEEGRGEVSYHLVGHQYEFPSGSEIPIELVRQAVKEFLTSKGSRPTCVQWRIPEIW